MIHFRDLRTTLSTATREAYEPYRDGIREAADISAIEAFDDRGISQNGDAIIGPRDKHSHLPDKRGFHYSLRQVGALNRANTRGLSGLGETALDHIMATQNGNGTHVLVLGPGSGRECFDIDQRLRFAGKRSGASMTSVGLTPFSPFHHVESDANAMARQLLEIPADAIADLDPALRAGIMHARNSFRAASPYSFMLRTDDAMALQEATGMRLMQTVDAAFCDHQLIGRFPGAMMRPLEGAQFNFIYEAHGPLVKADPMEGDATAGYLRHLLSQEGVFVFKKGRLFDERRVPFDRTCLIVMGTSALTNDENDCLMVHRNSDIAEQIIRRSGLNPFRSTDSVIPHVNPSELLAMTE